VGGSRCYEVSGSMNPDVGTYRYKHASIIGNMLLDLDTFSGGGMSFNH
jgi:hypothetical protein